MNFINLIIRKRARKLRQSLNDEKKYMELYTLERKLRDEFHAKELKRKLDEQRDDYERLIADINMEKDEIINKQSRKLAAAISDMKAMKDDYKKAKVKIDSIEMLVLRATGMMDNVNNDVNMSFARVRQKYLNMCDDVRKLATEVKDGKFKRLE